MKKLTLKEFTDLSLLQSVHRFKTWCRYLNENKETKLPPALDEQEWWDLFISNKNKWDIR